jgi:hypothetical protein
MAEFQVTCINKIPRDDSHEGITHLGGPGGGGWRRTRDQVVALIEPPGGRQGDTFYTFVGGRRANIAVVRPQGRRPYLRTHADGYYNNDLLALLECPLLPTS